LGKRLSLSNILCRPTISIIELSRPAYLSSIKFKWFKIGVLLCLLGLFSIVHFGLPRLIVDTQATQLIAKHKSSLNNNRQYARFEGAQGDTLAAFFSKATSKEQGTIILLHGIRGYKEYFSELATRLNGKGYNTLALDLRAHGDSDGKYCTYGFYEKYDVQKAVDFLITQGVDSNIGVWGQSLGGAIALQALAIEPRLKFGIIESTFSEFTTIVDDYSERMFGFSISYVNHYALYRASKIADFKPEEVSPLSSATNIHQPIFISHGTEDKHIKYEYGKATFDNLASTNKTFFSIDGAVHHTIWQVGGEAYFEQVFNFLSSLRK
jgi:alpha-beta hydrolase superfamily lysophospholipase